MGLRRRSTRAAALVAVAATGLARPARSQTLDPHLEVRGGDVTAAEMRPVEPRGGPWRSLAWASLAQSALDAGAYELRLRFESGGPDDAVQIPPCAGRAEVTLDGRVLRLRLGPNVRPIGVGPHEIEIQIRVSPYERRIACGAPVRIGPAVRTIEGLGLLRFASPDAARGGGEAVVFVPPGHDVHRAGALLVGVHPWNGTIWTYSAYAELLGEASARDVLLLMPSGLGNSLYAADAEREVLRAIDAFAAVVAVDPRAISIWGASMGGAGATTIGFHHPDKFAAVTSFFGDSKYDLSTYVRAILPDEAAAHRLNALDVADNARLLPVWLIHGEDDRTSPIAQSEVLADALHRRGFSIRFDRVPGIGHAGALVSRFVSEVVALAATARVPDRPPRVTYRSVRPGDLGAYGVRIVRKRAAGDAFVDVERRPDGVHVLAAEGVAAIHLARGALGTALDAPPLLVREPSVSAASVGWDPAP